MTYYYFLFSTPLHFPRLYPHLDSLVQSQSAPSLSAPMYVAVEKEEAGGDASSVGFWLEDKLLTYSESVEGEGDESTAKIAMLR